MSDYTLFALRLSDSGPSLVDEMVDQDLDLGSQVEIMGADGDTEQKFIGLHQQELMINFTSLNLKKALDAIGITAYAIPGNVSAPDTRLYAFFQQMAQDAGRVSGANHESVLVTAGMVVPVRITAQQSQFARYQGTVHARYDGTTEPLVFAGSATLPTPVSTDAVWTLGPIEVNGAALEDIQSLDIAFGLRIYKRFSDGDVWPKFLSIEKRMDMRIAIEVADPAQWADLGLVGTAQGATDSIIYLRKKDADGAGNKSNATAEHISFTIDAGVIRPVRTQASEPRPHRPQVEIIPRYDGTNPILAVNTATAIA